MKASFQLIIVIIFIALAIFGLLVFSGTIPLGTNNAPGALGTVTLWGTANTGIMASLIEEFNTANTSYIVKYVQKSASTFDQDLLEALANGNGPDIILLPDNLAYRYSNKISTIPYTSYPVATFKNNFAGAGEVFLTSRGMLAFPLTIDPLVMYYNRSVLDANNVVYPPKTWDDLIQMVPTLTKKDDSNKIISSAVALGDFSNVKNAKDILATLFMQAGNNIVGEKSGIFSANLEASGQNLSTVLSGYTDFADPNKAVYSWNKSFTNSSDVFSNGNLAFYFGFAGELPGLINKNPNENFFVAPFPQVKNANFKLTGAHVTGIAIMASTKNFTTAFTAASTMATGDFASKFALALGLPPARRDLLSTAGADAYSPIFYNSALYSRSWLDPSPKDTNNIFEKMVENVISGVMPSANAIADANSKMSLLLIK